jgi:hypothetical protein
MSVWRRRVVLNTILAVLAGLLLGEAACSPHATPAEQAALMHELRVCLNVDNAKSVPADVVSACPKKNVEILAGLSRDDLFSSLDNPSGCRHADGSSESWSDKGCRDATDVYYIFWASCKVGTGPPAIPGVLGIPGGIPAILGILFSPAGVVTRSRWELVTVWNGPIGCIP